MTSAPQDRGSAPGPITTDDIELFRAALRSAPIFAQARAGPADLASLESEAAVRVRAEVLAVRRGPDLVGRTYVVGCPEERPVGEVCRGRLDHATVIFTLAVHDVRTLRGPTVANEVEVSMAVGGVWPGVPEPTQQTLDAVARIVERTPVGAEVVAYLAAGPPQYRQGTFQFAHPDGWAAIVAGRMVSLAAMGDDEPGLGGVTDPAELPD